MGKRKRYPCGVSERGEERSKEEAGSASMKPLLVVLNRIRRIVFGVDTGPL